MKKYFSLLIVLLLMISMLTIPCAAASSEGSEVIYLEDGSYYVMTITTLNTRASNTVSGYRTWKYYNANDVLQWTYKLNATFTYTPGVSAQCTVSVGNVTIDNSRWSYDSQVASAEGATARGQVTMKYKVLGVTTLTIPVDITITCDTYGNLT